MLSIVVAISENNVIGKNGKIPWKIKGEQKQFKELTTGNVVIMGRNSYDEIGHPLPNRETIVISNTKKYIGENLHTASSVKEAIEFAKGKDVYIAGGYGVYKEAIPLVDVMYITEININVEQGDAFFPEFDDNNFNISIVETSENNEQFIRKIYRRKNKQ